MPRESVVLDAKDKKILFMLSQDARTPLARIARKARVSKQVVDYRIRNMAKRGVVKQFITLVNWPLLGYPSFRLYLRLANIPPSENARMINALKSFRNVYFVGVCEGKVDLVIRFLARSAPEFQLILDEFLDEFGAFIWDKEVTMVSSDPVGFTAPGPYLWGEPSAQRALPRPSAESPQIISLDKLDWNILKTLADDTRLPYVEIASATGTSPDVVAYRIRRMQAQGVIRGFKTHIDTQKLGFEHHQVFLRLSHIKPAQREAFFRFYANHPNVTFLLGCIGNWDVEIGFDARSTAHFHELVLELKEKFGGIIRGYDSAVVFEMNYPNAFRNIEKKPK